MAWLVPFEDLTLPQQQAVEADAEESQLLIGGPGAGKTVVLAHRLKRLLDDDNEVHLFAYTKSVTEYIQNDLEALRIAGNVSTIDSWAKKWFQANIRSPVPQDGNKPDFDAIITAVTQELRGADEYLYNHVLVDEGQDLDPLRIALLKEMTNAFTIAADDKQLLFTDGTQLQHLQHELNLANHSLLATYRCCEFISRVAARFLNDTHAAEFVAQTQGYSDNARQVAWKDTDDYDEEMDALAQAIQDSQNQGDATLAILAPTNRAAYGLRKQLEERGVDCGQYESAPWKPPLDLSKPVILTYHSAKGLTVDAVFLPRLKSHGFGHFETNAEKMRTLFVGITRATSYAWLGGSGSVCEPVQSAIEAAVTAGDIFRY
jgi:superfamily I DNA/RNA helicase